MLIVRLAQIDQCQHHENERLQQHDQNVEDSPDAARNHMSDKTQHRKVGAEAPSAAQQRDQQKQQLAGIHVAEQSHAERNRLGDIFNDVEEQVRDP